MSDPPHRPSGGVLALGDEDWQDTINANLFAAVRLDRAVLSYAAAKAALTTYRKGLVGRQLFPGGV